MMNPGRRLFLRNLGALAALAVVPSSLKALAPDDHARLMEMMRTGVVRGQYFLVTRPVVIEFMDGLLIDQCTFEATFTDAPILEIVSNNVTVTNSRFTMPPAPSRFPVIQVR